MTKSQDMVRTFKRPLRPAVLLTVLLVLPGSAIAGPVEVAEETDSQNGVFACSIWVEPVGDQYEWTDVCASEFDQDADGTIDYRRASITRSICDESDPNTGSWCYSQDTVALDDVSADELVVDFEGGTVRLHADLASCRVDADWTAVSDARVVDYSEVPRISPFVYPPRVGVRTTQRHGRYARRDATFGGSVCPQAEVSGAPRVSVIVRFTDSETSTVVTIDPTA